MFQKQIVSAAHPQLMPSSARARLGVPSSVQDLLGTDVLRVAAFRYELEKPGSDLFEVLMKEKSFEDPLHAA